MKVLILAAGYATRLYPLTLNKPKPLLEVGGMPIVDHILRIVEGSKELTGVLVVTNNKFHKNFNEWKDGVKFPHPIEVINDGTLSNDDRLGAIGDMNLALQKANIDEDLMVIAGDNLFDFELDGFVKFAKSHDGATVGLCDVRERELAKKYGIVKLDDKGKVTLFVEKPADPPSMLAAMCIYYFSKENLHLISDYIATGKKQDAPGNLMAWLAGEGRLYGFKIDGRWFDIGDKASLEKAEKEF